MQLCGSLSILGIAFLWDWNENWPFPVLWPLLSAVYSQQKQDRELTMARIMNSLLPNSDWNWRKWRKPLRYDLNQIPYDCTVEVRNRFKGLDLIDRLPDELWMEVRDIVQGTGIKTSPKKKKCKKAKWLSEEALRIDTTRDYHTKWSKSERERKI